MIFWYFLVIVAFIWLVFATFVDLKKREVPDWISYSLVAIGIGSRLIYSLITSDFNYILWGLIGFGVFFAFANLMYYTKQWGGGDSKLLMGLGAMFGNFNIELFYAHYTLPFIVTILVNIFIAGTVYGIFYAMFLGLKNFDKVVNQINKTNFMQVKIFSSAVLLLAIVSFFIFEGSFRVYAIMLLFAALFAFIVLFFMKLVEDSSLYKLVLVGKLTEGDWLAANVIVRKKVICHARNIGLTKKDIIDLKKNNVRKVLIYFHQQDFLWVFQLENFLLFSVLFFLVLLVLMDFAAKIISLHLYFFLGLYLL